MFNWRPRSYSKQASPQKEPADFWRVFFSFGEAHWKKKIQICLFEGAFKVLRIPFFLIN